MHMGMRMLLHGCTREGSFPPTHPPTLTQTAPP
jgi:hypothetical protein